MRQNKKKPVIDLTKNRLYTSFKIPGKRCRQKGKFILTCICACYVIQSLWFLFKTQKFYNTCKDSQIKNEISRLVPEETQ